MNSREWQAKIDADALTKARRGMTRLEPVKVGTANIRETLHDYQAEDSLRAVLDEHPDILFVQEWPRGRNEILDKIAKTSNYRWVRAPEGGGPILYDHTRFGLLGCRAKLLAPEQYVGQLPGRKSTLQASYATLAKFTDEVDGGRVAAVNFHLTAEVQDWHGTYHQDAAHKKRVRRHRAERRALGRLATSLRARQWEPFFGGDSNFEGMKVRSLTSCWKGRKGGTLGNRAVDGIWAAQEADRVETIRTASDHDAVVVTYRKGQR